MTQFSSRVCVNESRFSARRLKAVPLMSLPEVFAVIDLYGQCVQVSITSSSGPLDNSLCTSNVTEKSFPIHSPGAQEVLS